MNQNFARSANAPSKELTTKAQVGMIINHFGNNVCVLFAWCGEHLDSPQTISLRF